MKESNYTNFANSFGETGSTIEALQSAPVLNNTAGDPPDDDIYVLLQGPAHIKPLNGTDAGIEVTFLNETGNRKQSLFFKPDQKTGTQMLKVASLDLIIECNKAEFEALTQDDLKGIFPNTYYEIEKTDSNQKSMNTTDPPIKR